MAATQLRPSPRKVELPPLHEKQRDVFYDESRFKVVVTGRQFGKALALDTPIPSPTGWTTMGALRVGSWVFDDAGQPAQVTFATDVMFGRECSEVVFDDGSTLVADAEHQWLTYSKPARKALSDSARHAKPSVVTTAEIAASLRFGNETNHAVQVAQPLRYPERKVAVEPYVLGVWLGDGSSATAGVTCADSDAAIMERIAGLGYEVSRKQYGWRTPHWRIYGIQAQLRALGVLGNKHIPSDYLYGSIDQREELLKGLMDTDGGVENGRFCSFTTTSDELADGFEELVLGLGYRVRRYRRKTSHKPAWTFVLFPHRPVFSLERKLQAQMRCPGGAKRYFRYIKEVRPIESVPVRCIQVDSPNALFLAGRQAIPTHNTNLGAVMCVAAALRGQEIWWVAPTFDLTERGWKVILALCGKIPNVRSEGRPVWRVTFPGGGSIQARSSDNPDSLRGATLDGLVFDECAQAKPQAWPILRPTLSVKRGWAMFISTPKGLNWFYDVYQDSEARDRWKRWRFPSSASPYISDEEIEEARTDGSMSSLLFAQEYLAEFIATGESQFRQEWIQNYRMSLTEDSRTFSLGNTGTVDLADLSTFHTVDLAWSQAEDADFTVISTWGLTPKNHLLWLDMVRGHFEGPDILPRLRRQHERWGGVMVVERATRQMSIIQEAVRAGLPIHEVRADKDKITRSWPAQARMEQGTVWFPPKTTPWYAEAEEEVLSFPVGRHDDVVDTLSYAALHVARRSSGEIVWI